MCKVSASPKVLSTLLILYISSPGNGLFVQMLFVSIFVDIKNTLRNDTNYKLQLMNFHKKNTFK